QSVLGPARCLHSLSMRGRGSVHMSGNGSGADERYPPNQWLVQQRVNCLAASVYQVYHSLRESNLVHQFKDQLLREWHLLGWFHYEGITGGDRIRHEPKRHHHWKVERGYRGEDSEGSFHS